MAICYAQSSLEFQNVGGDFGRSWTSNFFAQNPQSAENKSRDLWSWGGIPKGHSLVDGVLMPIQNSTTLLTNGTINWLGETYVDPYTGTPVYGSHPVYTESYGSILPPIFNSNDPWA